MEIPDDVFDSMLEQLEEILEKLKEVNELTGATKRAEMIRKEIETYGWQYIVSKYHPDINVDDPAAVPLFEMYKFVYEEMQKDNKKIS